MPLLDTTWQGCTISLTLTTAPYFSRKLEIYKWLRTGRLRGAQVKAGLPWHVVLEPESVATLRAYVARARRVKRCKKEAS